MKVKVPSLKLYIFYFMVIYILNKNLIDAVTFGLSKMTYYFLLMLGTLGAAKLILGKYKQLRISILFFLIYLAIVVLNGIFLANEEQRSVGYMTYIVYPLAFFAILYYMEGRRSHQKIFRFVCLWGPITSILAIMEYIRRIPILPSGVTRIYTFYDGTSAYRASVFIGSPMILAVVLAVSAVLALYFFRCEHKKKYLLAIILDLVGIFCTGSRGPLVCVVVGFFAMYVAYYRNNKLYSKTILYIMMMGMAVGFIAMLYVAIPGFSIGVSAIDNIVSRFASTFNFQSEWGNVERIGRWTHYIGEFLERPVAGVGIASTSAVVSSNVNVTAHGITTESGLLARLVETGLIGTISYYAFIWNLFGFGIRGIRKKGILDIYSQYYFIIGGFILILVEDIILQVSLDIFCMFFMCLFLAEFVDMEYNRRKALEFRQMNSIAAQENGGGTRMATPIT